MCRRSGRRHFETKIGAGAPPSERNTLYPPGIVTLRLLLRYLKKKKLLNTFSIQASSLRFPADVAVCLGVGWGSGSGLSLHFHVPLILIKCTQLKSHLENLWE